MEEKNRKSKRVPMSEKISVKESMAIGGIANFFGPRFGNYRIDRILSTLGLSDIPDGNKAEKISYVLRRFYKSTPHLFVQFVNTLIAYHKLIENDLLELGSYLDRLSFKLQDRHVVFSARKEKLYTEPRPFDAFKDIEEILRSAKNEIKIIDPYVDHTLFTLYLIETPEDIDIKLLTYNMYDKFKEVARKFKAQRSKFKVRRSDKIHERYIIVDNRAWIIGQSIKDAGRKPLSIIELNDVSTAFKLFEKIWNESEKFL